MDQEIAEIGANGSRQRLVDVLPSSIGQTDFKREDVLVEGIITTNESYSSSFYEKIKNQFHPNGYIYGVGAGGIFTMLGSFESPPLGIIMVDIDPATILAGKVLVNGFKQCKDWTDFAIQVIYQRDEKIVKETMNNEADQVLQSAMISNFNRFNECMRYITMSMNGVSLGNRLPLPDNKYLNFPFDDSWAFANPEIVPITMIARNYQALRQLALDGQLAIVNGNVFDSKLLRLVSNLPKMKDSNSVIYTSNIGTLSIDIIRTQREYGLIETESVVGREDNVNKKFGLLNLLNPRRPHKNVFISHEIRGGIGKGSRMVARTIPPHYVNGVPQKPLIRA